MEQPAPAGETLTATVAGFPWTTRDGPAAKPTLCARPLAAPAKTATPAKVARANGMRRFAVALAVMSSGGVPRRHSLLRSRPGEAPPLGRGISAPQHCTCRLVAAHSVDAWARRCRRG